MSNKNLKLSSINFKDQKSFEKFVSESSNTISDIIKSESSKKMTPKRKKKIQVLNQSKKFIQSFKT